MTRAGPSKGHMAGPRPIDRIRAKLYSTDMNNMACQANRLMNPLVERVLQAAQTIDDRLEAALETEGLSVPKLAVLRILVQAGEPLPLKALSERLGCVKSNVTQLMDRLEAERLVRRVPDPHDRRSVLAEITEVGRERCARGLRAVAAAEAEILGPLSSDHREQLAALLARFAGNG